MNEITLNHQKVAENKGLNKYDLLQIQSEDITEEYRKVLKNAEGSLTTVSDNDAQSKIQVAITTLSPTDNQDAALVRFGELFKSVEGQIEPEKLRFAIEKTHDEEICIYRRSDNGLTNLLIGDDGSIAFSFIAHKQVNKPDFFKFYENFEAIDCEFLTFQFFSL